jgi:hypothetical protein
MLKADILCTSTRQQAANRFLQIVCENEFVPFLSLQIAVNDRLKKKRFFSD